jgi:acetylornithine deacetylase/succinyl-diaminopimelate desuccinylase-like protein
VTAVRDAIIASRDRFLAECAELLSIPSIYTDPDALELASRWLEERLGRLGTRVERLAADGAPAALFAEVGAGPRRLLSYSHYDVQPADPVDQWVTPAFEPAVRDGKLYARGAADDKGDVMARIHAVEIYRAVYGEELPIRLKFLVEGEEEAGSPHLAALAARSRDMLRADGVLWESGGLDEAGRYVVYCGVKGIAYFELRVRGASHDLHSSFAAMAPNPAWRLVHALSTLKDHEDNITVDGLMEHVRPASISEFETIGRIPFDGAARRATWGIDDFVNGMDDRAALVRFITAPTCTICGLRSGFIEEGDKTVLPSEAMAKLDFRLVPDLTPELVERLLRNHLARRGYGDIEIKTFTGMYSARSDPDAAIVLAAAGAAETVYGQPPVVYPSAGGSGPLSDVLRASGSPGAVMAGVGYHDTRIHSPNENIRLDDYWRHIEFLVELFRRFAAMPATDFRSDS